MVIKVGQSSYGTRHGTLYNYDDFGNNLGALNINGYGIFMVARQSWDKSSQVLWRKSVGTGITIVSTTLGSAGAFDIVIDPGNATFASGEYVWELFVNPQGTTFSEGTTRLKSVGSGIFEILQGAWYGTA